MRKIKLISALLVAGLLHAQGVSTDLKFETSSFMRHSAYRNVPRLNPESAPDGAYGPVNRAWHETHEGNWYIEEQRYGADLAAGGIATNDTAAIERALKIFEWGFKQQQSDGGFRCPDSFHSTSFFVEAVAHSLLLIEGSEYASRYRETVDGMKPKLAAAAHWMTRPANENPGREHNKPYTHRRYLVAAALGETGVLLKDRELIAHSASYIHDGIQQQDASGFNPERAGYDSSYHAVGMFFAERYYTIVADDSLRAALRTMLEKGVRWEASRIRENGEVSTEGNSRVGGARVEKGRSGKEKTVAYGTVYRAFEYWSVISGETSWSDLAKRVARFAKQWRN
jgi:hypothetical protein